MCVLCAVVGATENDAPFDHFTKSKHLISMALRLTVVTFRFPLPYGSQDCYYINLNIFSICQTAAMEIPHQFLNQSVTAASAVSLCNASDFRPRTRRPYPHPTAQPPLYTQRRVSCSSSSPPSSSLPTSGEFAWTRLSS
jgi:hypothetical protein